MKRPLGIVGAVGMALAIMFTPAAARGLAAHHVAKKKLAIDIVLDVGGVNDHSFNHLAYVGLARAGRDFHAATSYVTAASSSDYVPLLTLFAKVHPSLVIGVGFNMAQAMYTVATQFPNQKFALIDAEPADANFNSHILKNVADLLFKEQESGYLVGVMAGLMEKHHIGKAKHNIIGWMGGISIPPVNHYIAGYMAGARKVDPTIQFRTGYSQSFTDVGKGKEIGLAQISQGADILFQVAGNSGNGYLAAAQQKGVYGIGVDADESRLGKYVMTSALKRVDQAVYLTAKSVFQGKFKAGDHRFDLHNGSTGFAPPQKYVPASIVAQVEHYQTLIAQGKIVPPQNIPGS